MLEDRGFHNKSICYLKPANLSLLAFDQKSFGNIPEHLILFLGLGLISTIFYCLLSYCQVFKPQELQEGLSTRPGIVSLILGRQDAWLNKYRGEEVVNYIRFQRLIILESLIILVFSLISFTINWNNKEAEEEDILASTTILTLDSVSSWQWYSISISLLLPVCLVLFAKFHFSVNGSMEDVSSELSCTVVIQGVDPVKHSEHQLREWLRKAYPSYTCVSIEWARSTVKLRRIYREFLRSTNCIKNFYTENHYNKDGLNTHKLRQKILESQFMLEQNLSRIQPLPIVFISFETNQQAVRFVLSESLEYRSTYSGSTMAPLPNDIIWENLRHPLHTWGYYLAFKLLAIVLLVFFSTPAAFAGSIEALLQPMVDKVSRFQIYAIPFILSCIPTLLFILFGYLIQGIVKLSIVQFGGWERQKVIPEYMVGLFSLGFLSIVILPVLALSSAQNITEFLLDTFQPMEALLDTSKNSSGANLYNRRWECLFLPDSGAFFMNYLIISAGLRNHLSLHRFQEYLEELWGYCFHRYSAVKRVEVEKTREFNCIRNSENMSLAEDYTWILLHFSILSFFCVSFPLISLAFIVYILSKHVIDVECFRKYFKTVGTQPALLRTAIEINIFCGLLVQLNTVAFLFFRTSPGGEGLVRRMVAGNLIIFSILIFLIMESSRWRFPCNVFGNPKPRRSKPISNQIHEYRDRLFFEHLVTSI